MLAAAEAAVADDDAVLLESFCSNCVIDVRLIDADNSFAS